MPSFDVYWAHSDPPQRLSDHLVAVSALARELAYTAAPEDSQFQDLAAYAGLLHDLGKYSDCFQEMIRGKNKRCRHAIHGAAIGAQRPIGSRELAFAVAGHHAGLADQEALKQDIRKYLREAMPFLSSAKSDCAALNALLNGPALPSVNLHSRADLYTRTLFSCLVDADRLDTAGRTNVQTPLDAQPRLRQLLTFVGALKAKSAVVQEARSEVLEHCLAAAHWPERILSLSVPTGGGKTLAAMALALKRAALDPAYRRILVVIPYLSIIEQNAAVYRDVFGDDFILEHHSGTFEPLKVAKNSPYEPNDRYEHADIDEEAYRRPSARPETENWDAPCIVTTSVRFFESIFSNRPSDLRRVHNVARSIVILDEVQVLPRRILAPLLSMIEELCRDWGCTFILSTATKPAFEKPAVPDPEILENLTDRRWAPGTVREVIPEPRNLHQRLQRVKIDWRIAEPVTWDQVAEWMRAEPSALCVVNTREHARLLYERLSDQPDELFHLSTRMCPAHRLKVIATIRDRLKTNLPCRLVSTQLIEAGVDVDFPVAFRAIGPLDSVVQTAGRVDREGRLTAELGRAAGRLVVFLPADNKMPPLAYKEAALVTLTMARSRPNIQGDDLPAINEFFERYYRDADTGTAILQMREECEFRKVADEFSIIDTLTQDVYVPYGNSNDFIEELHRRGSLDLDLRRKLQPYSVGLLPNEFSEVKHQLNRVRDLEVWTASETLYDPTLGFRTQDGAALIS